MLPMQWGNSFSLGGMTTRQGYDTSRKRKSLDVIRWTDAFECRVKIISLSLALSTSTAKRECLFYIYIYILNTAAVVVHNSLSFQIYCTLIFSRAWSSKSIFHLSDCPAARNSAAFPFSSSSRGLFGTVSKSFKHVTVVLFFCTFAISFPKKKNVPFFSSFQLKAMQLIYITTSILFEKKKNLGQCLKKYHFRSKLVFPVINL